MMYPLILTCPKGLETLLLGEAEALGLTAAKAGLARVVGQADMLAAYRLCLWSRLANRVLLQLAQFPVASPDDLYAGVSALDWSEHLAVDGSLAVEFTGQGSGIDNSHFGALKVKDGVVDQFRARYGQRPQVDRASPDVRLHLHLEKGEASLALDLSGTSLHQRGYRLQQGAAPLKENLAAALLLRAGWPAIAAAGGALTDPMCGVGTLLIEAGLMAADVAPNLHRQQWGFSGWLGHIPALWGRVLAEAEQRAAAGLAKAPLWIRGYEADPRLIQPARNNIERAGLGNWIKVYQGELATFAPHPDRGQQGLVICNPPYGERLGDKGSLLYLYRNLGQRLREHCLGWQAAVFTGSPELGRHMGLRSHKQYAFWNGAIACKLLLFDVVPERFVTDAARPAADCQSVPARLSAGAQMFANRLRKNASSLAKWAKREGISCYRLYDADMPEYALAVDRYQDWLHVQEYAAPRSVDPDKAMTRWLDALAAIPQALGIAPERVVIKRRQRQSGNSQYQKQGQGDASHFFEVSEGPARLLVNLKDYLDTGLFLDHRPMRRRIAQEAAGKRFLNLFCYTATASVQAALGDARDTLSVDLSATYLDWARRNLALNGFSERHQLVRADVLPWLAADRGEYDLIFIDPPTFSNSKRMPGTFEVQRDHGRLIELAMARLAPGGTLYFSNNYRRFVLDEALSQRYQVEDISSQTLDMDFARNPKIHRAWKIQVRTGRP